jgi:hypothetical protein
VSPLGIVKLKVAADEVPTLFTVAELPAAPVVTVPTAIVAADPFVPFVPLVPAEPLAPLTTLKVEVVASEYVIV